MVENPHGSTTRKLGDRERIPISAREISKPLPKHKHSRVMDTTRKTVCLAWSM